MKHKIKISRNGKAIFFTDSLHKAVNVCCNHYEKDGQACHIDTYGDIELDKTVVMDGSFTLNGHGNNVGASDIFEGESLFWSPPGTRVTFTNCDLPDKE